MDQASLLRGSAAYGLSIVWSRQRGHLLPAPSASTAVPAITQAARDMCCNSHKDFGLTFADSSSGFRKRWVRVKCTLVGSSFAEYAEEQEQGEPENYETQAQNRRESTAKAK